MSPLSLDGSSRPGRTYLMEGHGKWVWKATEGECGRPWKVSGSFEAGAHVQEPVARPTGLRVRQLEGGVGVVVW